MSRAPVFEKKLPSGSRRRSHAKTAILVGVFDFHSLSDDPDELFDLIGAPRPMKMGTIPSPWRYDAAASHARAPLKHPLAYDLALRPKAAIFQCHGRLGWALTHPRNRVYVGC